LVKRKTEFFTSFRFSLRAVVQASRAFYRPYLNGQESMSKKLQNLYSGEFSLADLGDCFGTTSKG
jgi:hypothetical protein